MGEYSEEEITEDKVLPETTDGNEPEQMETEETDLPAAEEPEVETITDALEEETVTEALEEETVTEAPKVDTLTDAPANTSDQTSQERLEALLILTQNKEEALLGDVQIQIKG